MGDKKKKKIREGEVMISVWNQNCFLNEILR